MSKTTHPTAIPVQIKCIQNTENYNKGKIDCFAVIVIKRESKCSNSLMMGKKKIGEKMLLWEEDYSPKRSREEYQEVWT